MTKIKNKKTKNSYEDLGKFKVISELTQDQIESYANVLDALEDEKETPNYLPTTEILFLRAYKNAGVAAQKICIEKGGNNIKIKKFTIKLNKNNFVVELTFNVLKIN
jgi:hypothetical protein